MEEFRKVAGFPYCVAAIDSRHIELGPCPSEQHYSYCCYKVYRSLVIMAVCNPQRKTIFVQVGKSGMLQDGMIINQSTILENIQKENWLASEVPSLSEKNVDVRPYLLSACKFKLATCMLQSCSYPEKTADQNLGRFDVAATSTRKPVECASGMLKIQAPCG